MKYPIGTKYPDRHGRINTVVDYHVTTNLAGEVVSERYVVEREVMPGAKVRDSDVIDITIARALYQVTP